MKITASVVCLTLIAAVANAQTSDAKLSFEAASIKPAPPPDGHGMRVGMQGGPGTSDPERVTFENFTLSALIGTAYDVKWYQMPGLDMLDANRFNITATLVPGATKEQFRLMLRNLLAERFQLAVHKEMREIPIYALTVAKNGPKLKKAAADPQDDAAAKDDSHPGARMAKDSDGFPILLKGMTMAITGNRARLGGPKQTIAWLTDQLSGQAQRPVLDQTGLTGEYEFTLSWAPDANAPGSDSLPDLFTAVQQQLGLKLESKKGPVEVIIVDHAEKTPSGN
jgi:uncharacterized protein (TIGR03435 family)